jgi:hypothetical protein
MIKWILIRLGLVRRDDYLRMVGKALEATIHKAVLTDYLQELRKQTPHDTVKREITEVLESVDVYTEAEL